MSQQRITLHFSKANAARLFPTLHRLVSKHIIRARCPRLRLVTHHVPQALVVNQPHKDVNLHLYTLHSRVHRLITVVVVAALH